MAGLEISLFGPIQVVAGGQPVTAFESDKVRALLAYLAVEADQPQRREKLTALLWPNMPEAMARGNLRHALANLRQVIGDHDVDPPHLLISRQTIQFNTRSDHSFDIALFTKNQQTSKLTIQQTFEQLEKNIALYREDFLAGFSIADSIIFEEWMLVRREQYRRQLYDSLSWLADTYEQRGEYRQAIAFTRKRVDLQPWDEGANQQLMRLLALDDQRIAALAQFKSCRQILAAEFSVEPTAVTTNLYECIRDETWPDEAAKTPLPLYVTEEAAIPSPPLFVGRDQELRQLEGFLDQALTGESQVAFITGEAGSGKTALMQAFARQVMAEQPGLLVVSGKCSAYTGSGDPYQPFLEIINMLSGDMESNWEAGDISADHARRLWSVLPQVTEALVGNGRLLLDRFVSGASLLTRVRVRSRSQPPNDVPWLGQLAEWVQSGEMEATLSQSDLFEQFAGLLRTLARQQPLLLLIDDLQWIDQGSLNLLFHLGQNLRSPCVLILGAYRPEDIARGGNGAQHPLGGVVNELQQVYGHNQVDLRQAGGRPFIDAMLDSEPNRLDEDFRQALFSQTGGQALFTVELLSGLQERGDLIKDEAGNWVQSGQIDWDILPARVEAVIAGRIGRLPDSCRTTLTIASVEGEAFTAEVVAHIQNVGEQETVRCLSGDLSRKHHLITAQSRRHLDRQHLSSYRFHHFLIQQFLYNNLDPVERAGLHEAVGDALENLYGERETDLAGMFGQLAWHYQEAGALEKAIAYCQKAGERAWQLSAAHESISFFQQGLDLLEKLSLSPERRQQELALLIGLAAPLQATKGFAAPEVQHTYDRAHLLSQQVGETPQLFSTRNFLSSYYLTSGQYHTSLKLAQQNFKLGLRFQDDLQTALACLILAANYSQLGDFTQCREHLEKLMAFYDYRKHHSLTPHFGIDPGVNGLIWLALVLWVQGYPDQAEQQSRDGISLARNLEHPFSQTAVLEVGGGILHILGRNFQEAKSDIEGSLQIAAAQKFGPFQVEGRFYEGFLLVADGRTDEGISQMKQSLVAWRATGMRIMYSVMLGLLAQALGQAGQVEEGLRTLDEAFAEVDKRDERFFAAELYRIKGDLLQQWGEETAKIETAYQQAITIARRQAAKSWELRAMISLVELWQDQGKDSETRLALNDVFNWFTEGFGTPDLQEAKALLIEPKDK